MNTQCQVSRVGEGKQHVSRVYYVYQLLNVWDLVHRHAYNVLPLKSTSVRIVQLRILIFNTWFLPPANALKTSLKFSTQNTYTSLANSV